MAGHLTSIRSRVLYFLAFGIVFFLLPYLFPVSPSIGLSYVAQFNNRVALLVFLLGSMVYAYLTRGFHGREDETDQRLPNWSLGLGVSIALLLCLVDLCDKRIHVPVYEATYNMNRLYTLLTGKLLYRDVEYPYGPIHLYVPYALVKIVHCSAVGAYYAWWALEWALGAAMIWFAVRVFPLPLRYRHLVFWALLCMQLLSLSSEGIEYTPMRTIGAPALVLLAEYYWRRRTEAFGTALLALVGSFCGLLISPELGLSVTAGLFLWLLAMTLHQNTRYSKAAFLLFCLPAAALLLLASRFGLFRSMRMFSSGAYAFPILPGFFVVLALAVYVAAACAVMQSLNKGRVQDAAVLLGLTGMAGLPAALGRADMGHLQFASAGFLLGIIYVQRVPSLRRWWTIAAFAVALFPAINAVMRQGQDNLWHMWKAHIFLPRFGGTPYPMAQMLSGDEARQQLSKNCAVHYYSPIPTIDPSDPLLPCIDFGYYGAVMNVFTPAAMRNKIAEMASRSNTPILLYDTLLTNNFPVYDSEPLRLKEFQAALVTPPVRRIPLTFEPIAAYIQQNYVAAGRTANGLRIWLPKDTASQFSRH